MTNQPGNNDQKPTESDEGSTPPSYSPPGYTPPGADAGQGQQSGYTPPSYSAPSGSDAPAAGGYTPPSYGAPSGSDAPAAGGYTPPGYGAPSGSDAPAAGGYTPPSYGAPSTPDQSFGQTPSYGAQGQESYGQQQPEYGQQPQYGQQQPGYGQEQPGYGQQPPAAPYGAPAGGYDPNATGGYDPNAGAQTPYGAPNAGYGAPSPYGAPGGYQPNPYAPSGPVLATWGRRALGGLIDFVAPGIVVSMIIGLIFADRTSSVANLLSTVLTLGFWCYNTGYRLATTGYSFGHKIAQVRVVMADSGQTPTVNTAVLRAVCHLLDSWACLIGWLFPLWDAKKQTFADKITKTVSLDERNAGQR